MQVDAHYENPRLAKIYDAGNGWSADRDFYLALAGDAPLRILDLGCGTGLLCDAYAARGHRVTGVDPAASMLAVARQKPQGEKIEWVQASAQSYASENRYDLIIMTGHAFQVLLKESDVLATFQGMRKHLAPGGCIAFESRNPEIDWASRWDRKTGLKLLEGKILVERCVRERTGNRIRFETFYRFNKETLISRSELRFWTFHEIQDLLAETGLRIVEFFGDWDKTAFAPELSEEMIFIVKIDDRP